MRPLIVVIPGIGGSVLKPLDPGASAAWDGSPPGVPRSLIDPSSLSVDEYPELRPTGLVRGVTVFGRLAILPGYDGLVRSLRTAYGSSAAVLTPEDVVDTRAEVLLFPYDFRLGVAAAAHRLAASLHPLVSGRRAPWPGRPVVIIAHSMGGLVARYWAGPLGGWRHIAGLVTLGTPHRGAPKTLDWLVNGVRFGRTWQQATNVLRGWRGAWDLLPRYEAIWDEAREKPLRPEDLTVDCVQTSGVLAETADTVPTAMSEGAAFHADLEAGWAEIPDDQVPAVHAVFARGHETPTMAVLAENRLRVSADDPWWLPTYGWPGGDGTVPAVSAVPIELSTDVNARRPVWQRHGPLANSPVAAEYLTEYSAEPPSSIRGNADPGIALNLPDFVVHGDGVTATLHDVPAGPDAVMTLQTRAVDLGPGDPRLWSSRRMTRVREFTWHAELPLERDGIHEVRVSVGGAVEVSPLPAQDLIEVLSEDDVNVGRDAEAER